jgi:hypothetical protein
MAILAAPAISQAQNDPFSSVRGAATPPPNTANAPEAFSAIRGAAGSGRVGATSASGAAGRSYANGSTGGFASLSQIASLPRTVAPIPITVKPTGLKYLKGKTRVALTGYTLGVIRSGAASAYGGGFGSEQAGRRVSITTALVGVDDAMPAQLADEAYKDLAKRLTDAGFEVIPNDQVQASPIGKLASRGSQTVGEGKISLYAPQYAPIRIGTLALGGLTMPAAGGPNGDAAKALDAIVVNPTMIVDYENIGGSGNRAYSGNASVDAEVRFHLMANSGAMITVTPPPPYKGGWPGSLLMPTQMGTGEQFGIMYETNDKSDDRNLHNAIAMAGLGDIYRQSKVYAVEVDPGRYAALVRAAYAGLNTAIVAEMVKARGA